MYVHHLNRIGPLYCAGPIGTVRQHLRTLILKEPISPFTATRPKMTSIALRLVGWTSSQSANAVNEAGLKVWQRGLVEQVQNGAKPLLSWTKRKT